MSSSVNREAPEDRYSYWPDDSEPDPSDWCIYRVPHSIRKGQEEAYTPQIVSIGPFHCSNKELKDMDKLKRRYVKKFFERTSKTPGEVLDFIKDREQQIRNCYSETSNLKSDEYANMILRDAIFIIELILRNFEDDGGDKLLRIRDQRTAVMLDLLLLENQLPYSVLEEIYSSIANSPSFCDMCLHFFRSLFFGPSGLDHGQGFMHFTDLLRRCLVQPFPSVKHEDKAIPLTCATRLDEAGVKFTPIFSRSLLDVRFEGGKLRMPQFLVHHQTGTMLRNIMAWERCLYPRKTDVSDYVKLLDSLIEDERGAQLLVDAGIISNSMGDSKALASLFDKLGAEIPLSGSNYNRIYNEMAAFYQNKCNRNKAKLLRVYFGDIWSGTATIVASLLLILTFLQTITSLKQL